MMAWPQKFKLKIFNLQLSLKLPLLLEIGDIVCGWPHVFMLQHFKLLWTILFLSVASNNNNVVNIYSSVSTLLKDYKLSKVSCHCWLWIKTLALEPRRHRKHKCPGLCKRNFALTQVRRKVLESGGGGWEDH